MTAESGYSSHSLPSPLPAQMPQALPLSGRPQPSGCSPHPDPSPRPALLPHTQRKEVTLPALLWGPAGRGGGGLYCLLLSPFPSLTTGSISPNQLHLQDLLPVVRKAEQRWRGIGSRHPPTHSQLGTTQRHSHPFGATWSGETQCAEANVEGGPREDVQSPGAPD